MERERKKEREMLERVISFHSRRKKLGIQNER